MSLKTAYIQTDLVWENADKNLLVFEDWLAQVEQGTQLVVLPEMFTTGFSMIPQTLAEPLNGKTVTWMKKQSQKHSLYIAGSVIVEEHNQFYNRLIVSAPTGEIYEYNKQHLFRYAKEHLNYTTKEEQLVLKINDFNIAFYICYDLRFPVWSRNTDLKYDLGIYVANWPQKRIAHWDTLLQARAIENQSYILGVNRIGCDGNNVEYNGHSAVYNYLGKSISATTENKPSIQHVTLDKSKLNEYRSRFPAHLDADAFEIL